jgi:hypothetical protein
MTTVTAPHADREASHGARRTDAAQERDADRRVRDAHERQRAYVLASLLATGPTDEDAGRA